MTESTSISGVPPAASEANTQPAYSAASLVDYADKAAPGWQIAHKPKTPGSFGQRIDSTRESLEQLYSVLDKRPTPTYAPGEPLDPLLELRENPRLLRTVITEISTIRKKLSRMPRVIRPREGDEPRVVTVGDAYLQASGSVWHHEALRIFLNRVQQYDPLELLELWALAPVLKFLLLEEVITQADGVLKKPESHTPAGAELLKTRMKSLREIGYMDWPTMIEPLVVYDAILQEDPADTYKQMDFESREDYRKRISEIARYSDCSESQVAEAAIALAVEAKTRSDIESPRLHLRRAHVGYYHH